MLLTRKTLSLNKGKKEADLEARLIISLIGIITNIPLLKFLDKLIFIEIPCSFKLRGFSFCN